ncbi:sugar ABC transporter substrate-binding protein [Microbacterium capsulatum]|uniref:Sugar ABC transporter substrate-binding protein n=1 Tax=Microbacterium capsulatum TaxID=3041921 RepID=A0ABU0XCU9_9MICO|nr:sugar ABC transporter substrate-binding protein [Microbacterium sp. ASV81]MDQ4212941.1 sugar ABC transporter substrate-binding protein [Microbacterium sp. ASV81]
MNKSRIVLAVAVVATAVFVLDGCTSAIPGGGPTSADSALGTSLKCDASPTQQELLDYKIPRAKKNFDVTLMQVSSAGYYYQAIQQGAEEAAAKAGVHLQSYSADGYASPDLQLKQIGDAIARGTNAVVMAPSDIQGSVPVVTRARDAGLPVVNISSEVASKDVTMVMQDDYAFGQLAADRVAKVVGAKGGKGILIAGPANATWSQRRTKGFEDRVAKMYPNLKIVAAPTQNVDPAAGLKSFDDAVQANPDISWIFAVHYYILQPASLPTQYKGKVSYIAGGYEPDSITGLKNGTMDSVFGLAPRWMGILGVSYAVAQLNGEKLPRVTCVPIPLFTAKDIGTPFADAEIIP